jgi:DNA (cytosine-5)-methyltransferase 1
MAPVLNGISLFSGMGGDTLGMMNAGCNIIAFNEFDKHAINSHQLNFPNSTLICDDSQKKEKDKTNIQLIPDAVFSTYTDEVDIIFAGFSCQGFSNGGKKLPDDPRNSLFRDFARVTNCIRPKYIIGENVDGLLSRKTATGENYIDVIVDEFEKIGYNVTYQVCHTVKYGVPQLRKRLIIVGIRKDLEKTFVFPEPLNDGKTNLPNLLNIIKFSMEGAIKIEPDDFDMTTIPPECILTDMDNDEEEDTANIHPYLRLKAKTRDQEYIGKVHHSLLSFSKRDSPIHCEIIDIRNPSKTIICTYDHQPRLFVPLKNKNGYYIRCILPDELKQIQGFPADFKLYGSKKEQIKQIGNAVPPPLIQQIVEKILIT